MNTVYLAECSYEQRRTECQIPKAHSRRDRQRDNRPSGALGAPPGPLGIMAAPSLPAINLR